MSIDTSNLSALKVPDDARQITKECLSLLVEHLHTKDNEISLEFRSLPAIKQLIILNYVARTAHSLDNFTLPLETVYNHEPSDPRALYRTHLDFSRTAMKYFNRMFGQASKKKAGGLRQLAMINSASSRPSVGLRGTAVTQSRRLQHVGPTESSPADIDPEKASVEVKLASS